MRAQRIREIISFGLTVFVLFGVLIVGKFFLSSRLCPTTQGINGLLREKRIDYLFIGSSRTRQGYDIQAIEQATGKSAYLLAYNGMQAHLIEVLLDYLLARQQPPIGMIVLEFYPYSGIEKAGLADSRMYINAPAALKVKLLRAYLRTGMRPAEIYSLLATEGNEMLLTAPATLKLMNAMSYKGGYINKIAPGLTPDRFHAIAEPEALQGENGDLNPVEKAAYIRVFRLARAHHVPLVMVEHTTPQGVAQGRVYRQARAQMLALLHAEQVPYFTVSAAQLNPADGSLFADAVHLSTKGRALFSRSIVPLLQAHAAAMPPAIPPAAAGAGGMPPPLAMISPGK